MSDTVKCPWDSKKVRQTSHEWVFDLIERCREVSNVAGRKGRSHEKERKGKEKKGKEKKGKEKKEKERKRKKRKGKERKGKERKGESQRRRRGWKKEKRIDWK